MNIDYGKIIESAEQRRATLARLTELVNQSNEQVSALEAVQRYVTDLHATWASLDGEGKALLPSTLQGALTYLYPSYYAKLLEERGLIAHPVGLRVIARHAANPDA
jgi:hypothetical protein